MALPSPVGLGGLKSAPLPGSLRAQMTLTPTAFETLLSFSTLTPTDHSAYPRVLRGALLHSRKVSANTTRCSKELDITDQAPA